MLRGPALAFPLGGVSIQEMGSVGRSWLPRTHQNNRALHTTPTPSPPPRYAGSAAEGGTAKVVMSTSPTSGTSATSCDAPSSHSAVDNNAKVGVAATVTESEPAPVASSGTSGITRSCRAWFAARKSAKKAARCRPTEEALLSPPPESSLHQLRGRGRRQGQR
eukprot:CAMPEP_0182866158 /NCGR_PEP_ID=MMETSP0034_2-20130328/8061_1 /TAXON_ID=156128 /ORGANISM="Nephroselmis pyriformis, Strain CCMP717" /LENGTH=162 /DNA_ID=CAMNT_0024998485 /DNA_START=67 /DNA_END=555 /DNA_ORIENTATION=+